ncbi:hypothetical protein AKJ16_DCAP07240, partial [Drosera capensis]
KGDSVCVCSSLRSAVWLLCFGEACNGGALKRRDQQTNSRLQGAKGKMLTCITCAKQTEERGEEDGGRGGGTSTPSTKASVNSLTNQKSGPELPGSGDY